MGNQSQYSFTDSTSWGEKRKIRNLMQVFRNLVPASDQSCTLLEIGSGRGEFAEIVRNNGMNYIGVEPSESLRKSLQDKGFTILPDPIPSVDTPDGSIDIIYSYDVLEHMENYSTILSFFNESKRILKPDGSIVVIAPNAVTLGHIFYMHEYQHNYFTNTERTVSLLNDAGFEVTNSRSFLTGFGLSKYKVLNVIDRMFAHTVLAFARSIFLEAIMKAILGGPMIFKIHKNLYDHFAVIAKVK